MPGDPPAVWNVAIVFVQVALVAGLLHAHPGNYYHMERTHLGPRARQGLVSGSIAILRHVIQLCFVKWWFQDQCDLGSKGSIIIVDQKWRRLCNSVQ